MNPKLIIFDVGGVMVDGFDVGPEIAARLDKPLDEVRPLLMAAGADVLHSGGLSTLEFWRRFKAQTGFSLPGEPWGDLFTPVRRPAMYDLVERLKNAGLRVVAGTNTIDSHYEVHQRDGDYDVFDATYASHLMKIAKPDPEFWRHILREETATPAATLFVDDMPENTAAAAALGMVTVLLTSQEQAIAAVEQLAGLRPLQHD